MRKVLLLLALIASPAWGADVASKAASKAAAAAFVPCTASGCYGFYAGVGIMGTNQGANVLATGLNGITTGEQNMGVEGGYIWTNGSLLFGADVYAAYTINGTPIAAGYSAPKWTATQTVMVGGSLAGLLGTIVPPSTTGLQAQLLANIISPFIELGPIERSYGTALGYGGGILAAIDQQHWFAKVDYLHGNFNNVVCSPVQTCNAVDQIRASVLYKF